MINCGIIGFGKMGQIRHDAIMASGLGKVAAAFDPYCKDFRGVRSAKSAEDVIVNPKIDAIFVATPNFQNKPFTIAGLRAGKHVFCEKPPAFTASEVEEIREAEKASGCKLMYGFNHRHHESIREIKKRVDSGHYGRILWMRGRYGKSVDQNYFDTWRAKKSLAGGGILLDQGIHMLDLFLYLAGDFDEIQAMVSSLYWKLDEIEDNVFINLRGSRSGVVASLHSTMTQWRHLFSLEVFLEKGYMVLNGLKTTSGSYGDEILTIAKNRSLAPAATWQDEEKFVFQNDNFWKSEVCQFFDAILTNQPIRSGSSDDAANVMKIIDKVYSEKRHESLRINEKAVDTRV